MFFDDPYIAIWWQSISSRLRWYSQWCRAMGGVTWRTPRCKRYHRTRRRYQLCERCLGWPSSQLSCFFLDDVTVIVISSIFSPKFRIISLSYWVRNNSVSAKSENSGKDLEFNQISVIFSRPPISTLVHWERTNLKFSSNFPFLVYIAKVQI